MLFNIPHNTEYLIQRVSRN